jgi:hypothetical protein
MTTIQIPIDLTLPTDGNAFWLPVALTAYIQAPWQFVKDVNGKIEGKVRIPTNMAGTPNAKIKLVIAANATSGVTRLSVLHLAVRTKATAESLNPAALTAIASQDITVPGTAYNALEATFTVTETLDAEDELIVRIYHEGAHANDTLAVNTLLFDAFLEIDVT